MITSGLTYSNLIERVDAQESRQARQARSAAEGALRNCAQQRVRVEAGAV